MLLTYFYIPYATTPKSRFIVNIDHIDDGGTSATYLINRVPCDDPAARWQQSLVEV